MKKQPQVQRHLNLPVLLDEHLIRAAERENTSVNELCARALTEYLSIYNKVYTDRAGSRITKE